MPLYKGLDPMRGTTRGPVLVTGRIQFAGGTTTPDVIEGPGIKSAVHAGANGLYDIVLKGTGKLEIESVHLTAETPGNDFVIATVQTITESTRTIRIRWLIEAAGAMVATDADDNDAVHLLVVVRNTSLTR